MGKKRGAKMSPQISTRSSHTPITLRQETTGRIQIQGTKNVRDPKFLRLEHLKNIAVWASREPSIPSLLSATYGRQYAAAAEALGIPPDTSLIQCERCETILEPGFNCAIRIETTRAKSRSRRKKPSCKNNVVYKCHFCSHQNLMRGTPKGYMKNIVSSKRNQKSQEELEPSKSIPANSISSENLEESAIKIEMAKIDEIALPPVSGDISIVHSPTTPLMKNGPSLLDANRRKRNRSGSKKSEEFEDSKAAKDGEGTANASSKRKRKSWASLKEMAESNQQDSPGNIANLTIPFFM
ncbi:uncharacterized protein LOC126686001 isoform X2 [Mercurialis annua]|nr:uncharacterized protein LOC126686001 isoform X2 [Mercurialis annua]